MQTVRSVLRALGALIAVLLAALVPLLAGAPGVQASTGVVQPRALTIAITGMTPTTAGPNSTVTVRGTIANHTGSAVGGISVQAMTSTAYFPYPEQMTEFSDGAPTGTTALPLLLQQAGTDQVNATVPNGRTATWSVSFQAATFYDQFGVYPVEVDAGSASSAYTATERTFLPYWPGGSATSQVKGLQTAWVWPLIDTPQQGACTQTLRTSELASSVASGGRLSTLLDAGATYAQADQLTWDIDPALLSDVSVMTRPYFTHGNAECSERFAEKPSTAATAWLAQLGTSTAGEPAFLSPYANVDVAALSHSDLDPNIQAAYRLGETVAGQILPHTFGTTGTGTGDGAVLKAAWPADGLADAGVLTSLARQGGISTVVLSSTELPSTSIGEDALARTVTGVGSGMSVLLANSRITSLLGTASTARTPASEFTLTQDFLAQTAMIAAETPDTSRSLVIAPPTDWDPTPAVANALLSITDSNNAPWLHVTGLSTLAAEAARLPSATHVPAKQISGDELRDAYLDEVATVEANVSLFKDLLYQPPSRRVNQLDGAVATLESSAWRGSGSYGGSLATGQLAGYLKYSEQKVVMIASKKVLLAGQSGETPVSVENGLDEPIQVQVMATTQQGSTLTVDGSDGLLKVNARGSNTIKMSVHSSTIGTTTVQLQLVTQDGSPLSWTAQPLSVEVTRFGRLLLIIIGGALGILVLTSAYRLRRKRLAGARSVGSADETAEGGGTG
jgi:Family of unknown function (DUF6049)